MYNTVPDRADNETLVLIEVRKLLDVQGFFHSSFDILVTSGHVLTRSTMSPNPDRSSSPWDIAQLLVFYILFVMEVNTFSNMVIDKLKQYKLEELGDQETIGYMIWLIYNTSLQLVNSTFRILLML